MEVDDLLCSRNARSSLDSARDPELVEGKLPSPRVNGTSRTSASSVEPRASGWAGEKVARNRGSTRLPREEKSKRARRDHLNGNRSLAARSDEEFACLLWEGVKSHGSLQYAHSRNN